MAQENGDTLRMRQEAIAHAREMQRRSRSQPSPVVHSQPPAEVEAQGPPCKSGGFPSFLDDDGVLLLLLIFILSKERSDPKLILALLYVLL